MAELLGDLHSCRAINISRGPTAEKWDCMLCDLMVSVRGICSTQLVNPAHSCRLQGFTGIAQAAITPLRPTLLRRHQATSRALSSRSPAESGQLACICY